jgi:hypothetical protein
LNEEIVIESKKRAFEVFDYVALFLAVVLSCWQVGAFHFGKHLGTFHLFHLAGLSIKVHLC